MLQLRPTFSESWYRVAELKPKLRAGAQISRQFYRGDRWYVVRDPAGNQFHRLSDAAYRFVGLLDGRRTVEEAWDLVGGQLADDAPTQPEVIQVLSQLYAANLLETNITPDAMVLLRRHKKIVQQKMQNRLMNVLFPRVRLWDPDRFLCRWMPVARLLFSKIGAIVWLVVVGFALSVVLPQWQALKTAAATTLDFQHNLENIFWLYATFVVIKFMHECGHAFACRRFGGECHELGVMLLVLVPTPYVDASTAWSFPSKWQRVFVGAAGMIVELFVASLCAIVWSVTNSESYPLISQLAYNAMFVASVSTVIFNANPLLRYDGYYILSDWLEIPNLRQKSTEYSLGLIKRHVFRLKLPNPLPPLGQRIWLLVYAIASSIYRVFIGIMIIVIVYTKVPIIGVLMALGGVVTWAGVPMYQLIKYLALDPELHRKRKRAVTFSIATAVVAALLLFQVRFPVHVEFAGIVQPDDPLDAAGVTLSGEIKSPGEGRVAKILATDGQLVRAGQPLVQIDDPDVRRDLAFSSAKVQEAQTAMRQSRVEDQNELIKDAADLKVWQQQLADARRRQSEMTIVAPFGGRLVAPNLHELPGTFVQRGQEIGRVAVLDRLVIKGDIDQTDFQLLRDMHRRKTEVRLAGLLGKTIPAGELTLPPAAVNQLADPSLGSRAGGDVQVDPRDPNGMRTQQPTFEARVKLDNHTEQFYAGQRAYVRLTLDGRSLAWQWKNRFLQLIQSHDSGRWL
ncbi:MAG TPA: efflux RND transporter periplasmic adaptor subunit [Tepidisphaeraceae bacterium]|jgi:putative peptide zinc metalloprotease protein|nr:efflux RND transporter periplasmic adaptor subunit [Tepidisphaeraceae bacterium]